MKLLYDKLSIQKKILRMGKDISKKYKGKNPIFIGILNGGFIFLADLLRSLEINCEVDFIKVKSYEGMKSTGKIELVQDVSIKLNNRHVILVEDIIDSGNTIKFLIKKFNKISLKSLSVATFLIKPDVNKFEFLIDYIGFEVGQDFVVGYGLDYNQRFRNLDGLYILDKKNDF